MYRVEINGTNIIEIISQQICLVDVNNASDSIKNGAPNTIVIQCGSEKLLS